MSSIFRWLHCRTMSIVFSYFYDNCREQKWSIYGNSLVTILYDFNRGCRKIQFRNKILTEMFFFYQILFFYEIINAEKCSVTIP